MSLTVVTELIYSPASRFTNSTATQHIGQTTKGSLNPYSRIAAHLEPYSPFDESLPSLDHLLQ